MTDTDSFSRYSRWALAVAVLVAAASFSYRISADRAATAAKAAAQQAEQKAAVDAEAQQRMMAEAMVEQLAQRLKEQPERVDGWVLLMRSRMSLGQPDKAKAALADALKANPGAAKEIKEQAAALGVE